MRFRIVLPLVSVMMGVLLFHVGDMQAERLIAAARRGRGYEEPLQDAAAKARYAHYALNAPAWAIMGDTRERLWSRSTYWKGHDRNYLLAVGLMWFLIGLALDHRTGRNGVHHGSSTTWWNRSRTVAWACIVLGLFTCYSIFPRIYSIPFKNYLVALLSDLTTRGWWWYLLGLAWGVGLVAIGLHSLLQLKKKTV